MSKRARDDAPDARAPPPEREALVAWLLSCGCVSVSGVEIRASTEAGSGLGMFARAAIEPRGVIARLPQRCVLTAQKAKVSELGRAVLAQPPGGAPRCSDELLLLTWMAIGRRDGAHPFHAYLASLPCTAPDAPSWPLRLRLLLRGTSLGVAVGAARAKLEVEHSALLDALSGTLPIAQRGADLEGTRWAAGMYRSRGFPAALCPELEAPEPTLEVPPT